MITVRFEADEIGSQISDVSVQVPIFNDGIEEAIEEVFVIDLMLNSSINSQISIIRRSSLCRIIDDDGECNYIQIIIGYLHSSGCGIRIPAFHIEREFKVINNVCISQLLQLHTPIII